MELLWMSTGLDISNRTQDFCFHNSFLLNHYNIFSLSLSLQLRHCDVGNHDTLSSLCRQENALGHSRCGHARRASSCPCLWHVHVACCGHADGAVLGCGSDGQALVSRVCGEDQGGGDGEELGVECLKGGKDKEWEKGEKIRGVSEFENLEIFIEFKSALSGIIKSPLKIGLEEDGER